MRAIFLADGNIFTTGFSRMSERQLALWKTVCHWSRTHLMLNTETSHYALIYLGFLSVRVRSGFRSIAFCPVIQVKMSVSPVLSDCEVRSIHLHTVAVILQRQLGASNSKSNKAAETSCFQIYYRSHFSCSDRELK